MRCSVAFLWAINSSGHAVIMAHLQGLAALRLKPSRNALMTPSY